MTTTTRRHLMALAAAGLASVPGTGFAQLITTPAQPAGPFYPLELPLDEDNDLTRLPDLKTMHMVM